MSDTHIDYQLVPAIGQLEVLSLRDGTQLIGRFIRRTDTEFVLIEYRPDGEETSVPTADVMRYGRLLSDSPGCGPN